MRVIFSHYNSYGVVGNCDKTIKDFYLIPLGNHQPIPQVCKILEYCNASFEARAASYRIVFFINCLYSNLFFCKN